MYVLMHIWYSFQASSLSIKKNPKLPDSDFSDEELTEDLKMNPTESSKELDRKSVNSYMALEFPTLKRHQNKNSDAKDYLEIPTFLKWYKNGHSFGHN